jgi:hypothetical protein
MEKGTPQPTPMIRHHSTYNNIFFKNVHRMYFKQQRVTNT